MENVEKEFEKIVEEKNFDYLYLKSIEELMAIAREKGITDIEDYSKEELISAIELEELAEEGEEEEGM
jgi:hypothetical protein